LNYITVFWDVMPCMPAASFGQTHYLAWHHTPKTVGAQSVLKWQTCNSILFSTRLGLDSNNYVSKLISCNCTINSRLGLL